MAFGCLITFTCFEEEKINRKFRWWSFSKYSLTATIQCITEIFITYQ